MVSGILRRNLRWIHYNLTQLRWPHRIPYLHSTKALAKVISLGTHLNCPCQTTDGSLYNSSWESLFFSSCLLSLSRTCLSIQPWIHNTSVFFSWFFLLEQCSLTSFRLEKLVIFHAICAHPSSGEQTVELSDTFSALPFRPRSREK